MPAMVAMVVALPIVLLPPAARLVAGPRAGDPGTGAGTPATGPAEPQAGGARSPVAAPGAPGSGPVTSGPVETGAAEGAAVRAAPAEDGRAAADRAGGAAGPAMERIDVLTYNVCAAGNRDGTCVDTLKPARRKVWAKTVAGLIKRRGIEMASFTEMCYAQVSLLRRELPGYRFVWYGIDRPGGRRGPDRCRHLWGGLAGRAVPPDGKSFGMALAIRGRTIGPPLRRRLRADLPPDRPDARIHPRGLLCARGVLGRRRAVGCVTHISATESPRQVAELVAEYAAGDPVILTGDFNRKPGDRELSCLYGMGLGEGEYTEVDAAPDGVPRRGGAPTTRGGRKIDYIFATEDDFLPDGAEVISVKPELSDHRPLTGTLGCRR